MAVRHSPLVFLLGPTSQSFPSYLAGAATNAREALKHSEMVYFLRKFHSHAHNPWLVVVF